MKLQQHLLPFGYRAGELNFITPCITHEYYMNKKITRNTWYFVEGKKKDCAACLQNIVSFLVAKMYKRLFLEWGGETLALHASYLYRTTIMNKWISMLTIHISLQCPVTPKWNKMIWKSSVWNCTLPCLLDIFATLTPWTFFLIVWLLREHKRLLVEVIIEVAG